VFILGFPLSIISSILYQNYLLKKHQGIAEALNKNRSNENLPSPKNQIEFIINKFKNVRIPVHQLLYIEAVGNYIDVVYENKGIKKIIIRETIGNVEQKTCTSQNIFRTHRSYLVNVHYIKNIIGDSQGLKIHLKEIDDIIPVSRSRIKKFRELISDNI
jgi:DNA-binding LytR/AlgR family response regulator